MIRIPTFSMIYIGGTQKYCLLCVFSRRHLFQCVCVPLLYLNRFNSSIHSNKMSGCLCFIRLPFLFVYSIWRNGMIYDRCLFNVSLLSVRCHRFDRFAIDSVLITIPVYSVCIGCLSIQLNTCTCLCRSIFIRYMNITFSYLHKFTCMILNIVSRENQ